MTSTTAVLKKKTAAEVIPIRAFAGCHRGQLFRETALRWRFGTLARKPINLAVVYQ